MAKFWNFLFGKKGNPKSSNLNKLNIYTPFFTGTSDPEKNMTYMSGVNAHARHFSKAKPLIYLDNEIVEENSYLKKILTVRPNPIMNAPTFYEIIGRNYFLQNNAFIYIERDLTSLKEPIKNLWIIEPDSHYMEVVYSENRKIYIKFILDSEEKIVNLNDIIHISRNADAKSFFGKRDKSIDTIFKVMQTNLEGIEEAIKTSAYIRFLVRYSTVLNNEAKKKKAKEFSDTFLGKDSQGIMVIDGGEDVIPVESRAKYANAEEMSFFKEEVYDYLGINEKIVKGTFGEDEWQSYYESSLEPAFLKLQAEMTYKLFLYETDDYEIRIDANALHSASLKTRVQVANIIQKLPSYKPNLINELLFLPKTESGDKEFSNLNYVQTDKQNEYQLEDNNESK